MYSLIKSLQNKKSLNEIEPDLYAYHLAIKFSLELLSSTTFSNSLWLTTLTVPTIVIGILIDSEPLSLFLVIVNSIVFTQAPLRFSSSFLSFITNLEVSTSS